MPNGVNSDLLEKFYQHMKDIGTSEKYQKASLKAMLHFADHLSSATSFYDVKLKKRGRQILTKIKPEQIDSDNRWITT
jgi:hypothetical protein